MQPRSVIDFINKGETRTLLADLKNKKLLGKLDAKEVIDETFNPKQAVAFKSAWILEHLYLFKFDDFLPHAIYFLDRFAEQTNPSAQRHFGKILLLMTSKNAPLAIKTILANYHGEKLIETLFDWLITDKPVAVKAHCLSVLAYFAGKQTWVKEELFNTIDYLIDKESIAFYARATKIRKQLGS